MPAPHSPGTYVLLMRCQKSLEAGIGKLGILRLNPGIYAYVGSAFGSGGLAARLRHHWRISAKPHWHIDYLRAACPLIQVWYSTESIHLEHQWARALSQSPGSFQPMPGFGSSDCGCPAHLFWFKKMPSLRSFQNLIGSPVCLIGKNRIAVRELGSKISPHSIR